MDTPSTDPPVHALALNSGSSSLKFGLYAVRSASVTCLVSGEAEHIGQRSSAFRAADRSGQAVCSDDAPLATQEDVVVRISRLLVDLGAPAPQAIGHRVVHGGPTLRRHCRIDDAVLRVGGRHGLRAAAHAGNAVGHPRRTGAVSGDVPGRLLRHHLSRQHAGPCESAGRCRRDRLHRRHRRERRRGPLRDLRGAVVARVSCSTPIVIARSPIRSAAPGQAARCRCCLRWKTSRSPVTRPRSPQAPARLEPAQLASRFRLDCRSLLHAGLTAERPWRSTITSSFGVPPNKRPPREQFGHDQVVPQEQVFADLRRRFGRGRTGR